MTTGFAGNRRNDEEGTPVPGSWTLGILLLYCGLTALLLLGGRGGGLLSTGILRASYWALVAGLASVALLFFWRAVRLLRAIQRRA
jgi:hypothetical protein